MKYLGFILIIPLIFISFVVFNFKDKGGESLDMALNQQENLGGPDDAQAYPLSIEALRKQEFPGSDLVLEQTLNPGSNYQRYIASYKSEGLKIFGLLTVPTTDKPTNGYPVIVFNHGFLQPATYQTTDRYLAYQDYFARSGYITFKSDYRGHGNSEGVAPGGYGANAYTIDILNALGSLKKYPGADKDKIGMWGHSMGGFATLRAMVVTKDIKAGVIWGGVVASYPDLLTRWRRNSPSPNPIPSGNRRWRQQLQDEFGTPEQNPKFWNSISSNSYLVDISGPLELHHGQADASVPVEFSLILADQMKAVSKQVEVFTYPGDDHNISASFNQAMQRSLEFFDQYVKNK